MKKRGVSLSLNTIIIAIIVLIVLVVVIVIFTGRIGSFVKGTTNCEDLGGRCVPEGTKCNDWAKKGANGLGCSSTTCTGALATQIGDKDSCTTTEICCKLIYEGAAIEEKK